MENKRNKDEIVIEPTFIFGGREIPLPQTVRPVIFMVNLNVEVENLNPNLPMEITGPMDMATIINYN